MKKILFWMLLLIGGYSSYSQNGHRVIINATVNGCSGGGAPSFDMIFDDQTIYTVGKTGIVYDNTNYGSNPGSGFFTILVEGSFCIGSASQTYNFTGKTCHTQSFSGSIGGGASITGYIRYEAPSLTKPTIIGATADSPSEILCSNVTLRTTGSAGSYRWQVAQTTTSSFRTFATTPSNSTSINASTFDSYGFTSSKLYFRVTDVSCSDRVSLVSGGYAFGDPPPATATLTPSRISCKGMKDGEITISNLLYTAGGPLGGGGTAYDGSETLTYSVSTPGTNFSFSSSQTTVIINKALVASSTGVAADGVTPGDWTIGVENASGCGEYDLGTVTITEPSTALSIGTPSKTNETCRSSNNGTITVSPSGGWGGYTYSINSTTTYVSGKTFTGLAAGTYTMRVKDTEGCVKSTSVMISQPTAELSIGTPSKTNETCRSANDGTITINASNGWGGYTYSINSTTTYVSGKTFTGLAAGTYTMRVKDSEGCVKSTSVTISQPTAELSIGTPSKTNETCRSANDGTITINASNGWGGYTYSINSATTYVNGKTFTGLVAGTYTMRVKDNRGCVKSTSVTISQPATELSIGVPTKTETCKGTSEGAISLFPTGGWGGYTYSINSTSSYQSSNIFSGLAGSISGVDYTMRVKDSGGCVKSIIVTISEPTTALSFTTSETNVTCKGSSTGAITVTAANGWGSYTYSVNSTVSYQNNNVFTVSAGTHTIRVKDAEGCVAQSDVIINEPSNNLSFTYVKKQITCQGDENGMITINDTGGWGSTTYSIDDGVSYQSDNVFTGLTPGSYQLRVKDSGNCETVKQDVVISEPNDFLDLTVSQTDVICKGASDGTITLTGVGGWSDYTYSIDNGANYQPSGSFTGLGPATYFVVVKDVEGCETTAQLVPIAEPTEPLSFTYEKFDVSCKSIGDGIIIITATGGWSNYEYSKDGGLNYQSSNTFTSLIPATYNVRLRDLNRCETTVQNVAIIEPDLLSATAVTSEVSCNGGNNGGMTVTPSGGAGSYEYSINGGSTYQPSNIFSGLLATSYTITVKDGNDCTTEVNGTVGTPDPIAGSIVLTTPVSCYGDSDGALSITSATGGTGTLTYLWSTGATTPNVSNLVAGTYSVVVTDANACTKTFGPYTLTEPAILEIINGTVADVSCNTGSDGSIDITVVGGTLPYSYSWDNGSVTEDVSALVVGDYTIIITDARGCLTSETYTIAEPAALSISVDALEDVNCFTGNDGSVTLLPAGGTAPYEYSIDGGMTYQSSVVFNGLIADNYTFQVRDHKGCVSNVGDIITEPTEISISFQNIVHTTCGDPIGSAESLVTGGTLPYSYSWKDALNNEVAITEHINNVVSDVYTLEITDSNGCVRSEFVIISNIDGANFSISNIVSTGCHDSADGQATLTINSGVGPFTILWGSGETTTTAVNLVPGANTVEVTDANGCRVIQPVNVPSPTTIDIATVSEQFPSCNGVSDAITEITGTGGTAPYIYAWDNGQTGSVLSNVLAGDFQVTIIDNNLCSAIFNVTVQETPLLEVLVIESTNPTCTAGADGVLEVSGQGGTAPYTYDWGSLGTLPRVENLSSGNYPITIVDANGCMTTATLELVDPELLNYIIVSESRPTCNGVTNGFVEIAGTNGTAPYTYQWGAGETGSRLQNIAGGNYEVIITDSNGCVNTLIVPFEEPKVLAVSITSQIDPSCFGFSNGHIEVIASGGTAPYFYNWDTGVTGEELDGISIGTYTVNISDMNGCSTAISVTLSEPEPLSLSVIDFVLPTCYNTDDGIIEVAIAGGTFPYVTTWNTGNNSNRVTSLVQDDYQVTITDNQGCVLTQKISLTGVIPIVSTVTITDPKCYGYDDGVISLSTIGGTGTLNYLWNDGITDINRSALSSGDYSVTVTDENGCTEDLSIILTDPAEIIVDLADQEICVGGSHRATLDLGSNYEYTWTLDNGTVITGSEVNLDQTGIYTVIATDEKSCFGEGTFSLSTNEDLLQADFLMTTEGYVGDTIVIIDISWPLPDNVQWGFGGLATILTSNNDYAEVIFKEEGVYDVEMDATLAECSDYKSQQITILGADEKDEDIGGRVDAEEEPLITSVKVYPNPTDGQFSVNVDLSKQADINVRMIDTSGNKQLFSENRSGDDEYTMGYSLPNQLQPGIYFIIVNAENQSQVVKILIR